MKALLLALALLVAPVAAHAQNSEAAAAASGGYTDGWRVGAIALGAVGGVIVANYLTGGFLMPVMMAGGGEAAMGGGMGAGMGAGMGGGMAEGAMAGGMGGGAMSGAVMTAVATTRLIITGTGAVVGGYVGNWLYGQ